MATVYLLDSVKVATSTTGTGSVTVGAAEPGYLTPAEAGAVDGRVYTWRLDDGDDFEIFVGTYSSTGPTVSRDTVLVSKISGVVGTSKITLSGTAKLSSVPVAQYLMAPYFSSINGGPLGGFRNKIINGNFDIWQRGTSFNNPTGGTYTADRWAVQRSTSGTFGTYNISRQSFDLGQTDVPGEPTYFIRWDQTVATTGGQWMELFTNIESVRTLAGKTVTLTFWARADSSRSITPFLRQAFGTGGSPSSIVNYNLGSQSLTTSWQKFSLTTTLDSISGKTLGTDGNDYLRVYFQMPLDTTFTIDIARVSLVEGDATSEDDPFSPRHIQQELALCQRYFCKTYYPGVAPGTITQNGMSTHRASAAIGILAGWSWAFPVEMRTIPTVTVYNPNNGAAGSVRNLSGNADLSVSGVGSNTTGITEVFVESSPQAGHRLGAHFTADAEL